MWRTVIIALIVLSVVACEDSAVRPSSVDVVIVGRVLDYSTQRPVSSAAVTFALVMEVPPEENVPSTTTADADGLYALTVPRTGRYIVAVNGISVGTAYVNGSLFKGDLLIDRGTCIARYGVVVDSKTLRPIRGATIAYGNRPTTGSDGWYRLDLGCPAVPPPGGTTVMSVSHPDYQTSTVGIGRGPFGVSRHDIALDPK
jgi:hypothetical protein